MSAARRIAVLGRIREMMSQVKSNYGDEYLTLLL